jgi:hypothetical protein
MDKRGWLVNDCLTCIPGTRTFWHDLLDWFPNLEDKTGGYTDYSVLANRIESMPNKPDYIIRNGTYFRHINIDSKCVSLIQDVSSGSLLEQQLDVINKSDCIVFNSKYVKDKYNKYSININNYIIPLGIDFDFFTPNKNNTIDSIIYIGSSLNYPKGFNIMLDIIRAMPQQHFNLIMKDNWRPPVDLENQITVCNRVDQKTVRDIIQKSSLAICTSYEETQHLSGLECGACNIPIVARNIGWYYDHAHEQNQWGAIADDTNFLEKIYYVKNNLQNYRPRDYLINFFDTNVCKNKWKQLIETV